MRRGNLEVPRRVRRGSSPFGSRSARLLPVDPDAGNSSVFGNQILSWICSGTLQAAELLASLLRFVLVSIEAFSKRLLGSCVESARFGIGRPCRSGCGSNGSPNWFCSRAVHRLLRLGRRLLERLSPRYRYRLNHRFPGKRRRRRNSSGVYLRHCKG